MRKSAFLLGSLMLVGCGRDWLGSHRCDTPEAQAYYVYGRTVPEGYRSFGAENAHYVNTDDTTASDAGADVPEVVNDLCTDDATQARTWAEALVAQRSEYYGEIVSFAPSDKYYEMGSSGQRS